MIATVQSRKEMRFGDVIEFLHLPAGVTNLLLQNDIGTIDALCALSRRDLRKLCGIGNSAIEHIRASLAVRANRYLKDDVGTRYEGAAA